MESFHARQATAALGTPDDSQIEVIWRMGCASLSSNNNELVLPAEMASQLSRMVVDELKLRLSRYLGGAPTLAFFDQEQQMFRIRRVPELLKTGDTQLPILGSGLTTESLKSSTPGDGPLKVHKTTDPDKKIPRPANAFILYRKEHHPILKKEDPSLHNNDISVILGRKWKTEPESVKEHFKKMAERLKRQHAAENPGYQYTPRKPSEKKRRMTARKMALLQAGVHGQPSAGVNLADIAGHEQVVSRPVSMLDMIGGGKDFIFPSRSPKTAENLLETRRPAAISHPELTEDGRVQATMPSGGNRILSQEAANISRQVNQQGSGRSFDAEDTTITTQFAPYVTNDQDFFDSLVDWEAVAGDITTVKSASAEEMAELADVELGNPYLLLSEEGQRTAFEKEVDRTLRLFKR